MPILTYDHSYTSPSLAWDRCRAYIRCSAVNGFIAGDEIIHGDSPSPLDMQGKGSVELVATTANVRYEQVLELWRQGENARRVWTSGWFEFTEDADLKDLVTIDIPGAPTTALGEHVDSPTAHPAEHITFTPTSSIAATDVQGAIEEVAAEAAGGAGQVAGDLADHEAASTDVHGIPDTSLLETQTGAQDKADAAQAAAESTAAGALDAHTTDTDNPHEVTAEQVGAIASALVTAKGQIVGSAGAGAPAVLNTAGHPDGSVIVVDSASPLGLRVVTPESGTGVAHTGFGWYQAGATNPDTYVALDGRGMEAGALAGNTGYARQAGSNIAVQSRMRRCVVMDDGSGVRYYLDADDSTLIAGTWDGTTQTGWVRVYEGALDPIKPTPGQAGTPNAALRDGVPAWDAGVAYEAGARVIHDDALWDALSASAGIEPTAGTSPADLTGGDGQVMVEVPAFYYRMDYDSTAERHSYEVVYADTWRPFPDLTVEADLPDEVTHGGRVFGLHPTFTKASRKRAARYRSAFHAVASDTGNNSVGVLQSIADGSLNSAAISGINFQRKARNRNVGLVDISGYADDMWSLYDYWMRHALQLLFFTEYRSFYSQSVVGGGNVTGSVYGKPTGRTTPMGNATGVTDDSGAAQVPTTATSDAMTWRGIEDWWGTCYQWCDGWNIRNIERTEHWLCNTPRDYAFNATAGYEHAFDTSKGTDAWIYPNHLSPGLFLPARDSGSSSTSTYLTDGYYAQSLTDGGLRAARVGGYAGIGTSAGAALLSANVAGGDSGAALGAALIL